MVSCLSQLLVVLMVVSSTIAVLPCACDAPAHDAVASAETPSCCDGADDPEGEPDAPDCAHCWTGQCDGLAEASVSLLEPAVLHAPLVPLAVRPRALRVAPVPPRLSQVQAGAPPPAPPVAYRPATDPPTLQVFRC